MHARAPRLKPLAACLAAALALVEVAPSASAATPAAQPITNGAIIPVTNCNDSGPGSLRAAVAQADTFVMDVPVDMTQLGCSSITLTTGAITSNGRTGNLELNGPGAKHLTIRGTPADRVINHTGTGQLTIYNLSIAGGQVHAASAKGGCIYSAGSVSLHGSSVSYCDAFGTDGALGGAIYAKSNLALLGASSVSHNFAYAAAGAVFGGALFSKGEVFFKYSTASNNGALVKNGANNSAQGGAIAALAVSASNCTIQGNSASGGLARGGGIYLALQGGSSLIAECTISGNTAGYGGGIYAKYSLSISNSTIAFNTATCSGASCGGGLSITSATNLDIESSIIAKNITGGGAANDFFMHNSGASTITGSHNLVMISAANSQAVPGDTLHSDPRLQPLRNNGGITQTHALGSGSPAINHGSASAGDTVDQRGHGFARAHGAVDIGAFEVDPDDIFRSGFD